jgi:hypothetical protein
MNQRIIQNKITISEDGNGMYFNMGVKKSLFIICDNSLTDLAMQLTSRLKQPHDQSMLQGGSIGILRTRLTRSFLKKTLPSSHTNLIIFFSLDGMLCRHLSG